MTAIVVPATSIQLGPGYLYRAPIGSALPGFTTATTVTNKALTSNVATLTFASHTFVVGQTVTVALSPADPVFDGTYQVTAVTATTISYAKTNANVTGTASAGTVTGVAGGAVSGGKFVDAWPAAWIPWGVTREGSSWSYQLSTGEVTAAEYLTALAIVEEGVQIGVDFDVMQVTAKNYAAALNVNPSSVAALSGTGVNTLTRVGPPVVGQSVRQMIGFESSDETERVFFYQCLQRGNIQVQRRKGANAASLPLSFGIEQPAAGNPFDIYTIGTVRLGA